MWKELDGSKSGKATFPEYMNMMANRMKIVSFLLEFLNELSMN